MHGHDSEHGCLDQELKRNEKERNNVRSKFVLQFGLLYFKMILYLLGFSGFKDVDDMSRTFFKLLVISDRKHTTQ